MTNTCLRLALLGALACMGNPASCDEVKVAFGDSLMPFVFPKTNSGIEVDIFRESLQFRQHTLRPVYVPLARVPLEFLHGRVDAAHRDGGLKLPCALYADVAVSYHDAIIFLKQSNLNIQHPGDLENLSVYSFQGAKATYPGWLGSTGKLKRYAEVNGQIQQVKTLDMGRYDAIVLDLNIYKYNEALLRREYGHATKPVNIVYTGAPIDYRPVFRSTRIRDDFNAGLRHLKSTGRYQEIVDNYLKNEP
jgi:polar amino acid transport system substrate-binding protein